MIKETKIGKLHQDHDKASKVTQLWFCHVSIDIYCW